MFLANDQASKGIWVHVGKNTDLTWINPKWTCGWVTGHYRDSGFFGGDAMLMRFSGDKTLNGAWCDKPSASAWNSICKAPMSNS